MSGIPASRLAPEGSASLPGAVNVEVARARFEPRAHSGRGVAAVVEVAGGLRQLTLTDFATENGPDLRLYLVRGPVRSDVDVDEHIDLGRLKGNVGDQQYAIPPEVDIAEYSTVVVWCRAFSVNFAQADLAPS